MTSLASESPAADGTSPSSADGKRGPGNMDGRNEMRNADLSELDLVMDYSDDLAFKYPLVYRHSWNYAAKLIRRAWNRYKIRVVYKYLFDCAKEFEETLTPRELARIYPEFLENSDTKMTSKLTIRLQGESFPPCLVCRIVADMTPSVDGKRHAPKWIPLFNPGGGAPVDQKALLHLFIEATHSSRASNTNTRTSRITSK